MRVLFKGLSSLAICAAMTFWCPAQDSTESQVLANFSEQNFGVRFSHTTNLSTYYNPHGGADKVLLDYRGKALGGLLIRPAPPADSIKDFIEAGKAHYKERFGASSVDYEVYENPRKYKFHHLKAELKQNDEDYVVERFVYLRPDGKTPADEIEKTIRSISGAFSFEFIYPKRDFEKLKRETKTVIDTFRIGEVSAQSGTPK